MKTKITLWHVLPSGGHKRCVYEASCYMKKALSRNRIVEKGFTSADSCVIRIFLKEDIPAAVGDFVKLGIHLENEASRRDAMRVCEVRDNRRGGCPHWYIAAGG